MYVFSNKEQADSVVLCILILRTVYAYLLLYI